MSVNLRSDGWVEVFDGDFYAWYLNNIVMRIYGNGTFKSASTNSRYQLYHSFNASDAELAAEPSEVSSFDGLTFLTYTYSEELITINLEKLRNDIAAIDPGPYLGAEVRKDHLMFVPGRVAYERIMSYNTELSSPNAKLYPTLQNNQAVISKIEFNWCIESCLPPKYVYSVKTYYGWDKKGWAHNDFLEDLKSRNVRLASTGQNLGLLALRYGNGIGREWWREDIYNSASALTVNAVDPALLWGNYTTEYKNGDITRLASMWYVGDGRGTGIGLNVDEVNQRLAIFINDHIKEITIQLRRVKKDVGDKSYLNPYHTNNYDWVATIRVPANFKPDPSTQHKRNRDYINFESHNYMYGYGDCTILLESDSKTYAKWYFKSDQTKKYELEWRAGFPKYLEDLYTYYLTVEPEKSPISVYNSGKKLDVSKLQGAPNGPYQYLLDNGKWVGTNPQTYTIPSPGAVWKEKLDKPDRWDYLGNLTFLTEKSSGYMGLNHLAFSPVGRNKVYSNIINGGLSVNDGSLSGSTGVYNKYYPMAKGNLGYNAPNELNYEIRWHSIKNVTEIPKSEWWVRNTDEVKFGYPMANSDTSEPVLKTSYKYFRSSSNARKVKISQDINNPGVGPVVDAKYGVDIKITNDDLVKRMKTDLYSDYDSKIGSGEFLIYGVRFVHSGRVLYLGMAPSDLTFAERKTIKNDHYTTANDAETWNAGLKDKDRQYFSVVPKYDLMMVKGEHLAWFRVGTLPKQDFNSAVNEYIKSRKRFFPNIGVTSIVISPGTVISKRNVLIRAKIGFGALDFWSQDDFDSMAAYANKIGDTLFLTQLESFKAANIGKIKSTDDLPTVCGFDIINKDVAQSKYIEKVTLNGLEDGTRYDLISGTTDGRKYPWGLYVDNLTELNTTETLKYIGYDAAGQQYPVNATATRDYILSEYNLNDVEFDDNWFFRPWVEIVENVSVLSGGVSTVRRRRFYANNSMVPIATVENIKDGSTISIGYEFPVFIGTPKFASYPFPNPSSKGFWHQVYDSWIKVDLQDYSYFRRRLVPSESGTPQTGAVTGKQHSPIHYYPNMVFEKSKSYMFVVYTENHFSVDATNEDETTNRGLAYVGTPWGEWLPISIAKAIGLQGFTDPLATPSTTALADAKALMSGIQYFHFSNINAFSEQNVSSVKDLIKLGDFPLINKPIERIDSRSNPQNPFTITANSNFQSQLISVLIQEVDWILQGYAPFKPNQTTGLVSLNVGLLNLQDFSGKGWHIADGGDLVWFDKIGTNIDDLNSNLPYGGILSDYFADKKQSVQYLVNNFAAKLVDYDRYNLAFDYRNDTGFGIAMYTGKYLPSEANDGKNWWATNIDDMVADGRVQRLGQLNPDTKGVTQSCEFIGLQGLQYLFFIAEPVIKFNVGEAKLISDNLVDAQVKLFKDKFQSSYSLTNGVNSKSATSIIHLSNFRFTTTYNDSNNKKILVQPDYTPNSMDDVLYEVKIGEGNNVFPNPINQTQTIKSKIGNGNFVSGIWRNGVWNNGWRDDITLRRFFGVSEFYSPKENYWRIVLFGDERSPVGFSVGDRVSVSNVAFYNINGERILPNGYYVVSAVGPNYINVDYVSNSVIRNVVQDSAEHRILVSRNVWLTGLFLNGYFSGIWNSGVFSGYPMLAKMDKSHWIDGIFNGGHFTANKFTTSISNTYKQSHMGVNRLVLTFNQYHGITAGDVISIKVYVNSGWKYLGTTVALSVLDDFNVVTGIAWLVEFEQFQVLNGVAGVVYGIISDGLIQNFDFYANNVSTTTSLESMTSERVFKYNSWIDVTYSNQSAVNIGRPQGLIDAGSKRPYSENNLYGYPTNDVLSSNSVFRDSFSSTLRRYRLGKKYKRYDDLVGELSSFEDFFESTDLAKGKDAFYEQGWDFNVLNSRSVVIKSTLNEYTSDFVEAEPFIWLYFPKGYVPGLVVDQYLTFTAFEYFFRYAKSGGKFKVIQSSIVKSGPATYTKKIFEVQEVSYGSRLVTKVRLKASSAPNEFWRPVAPQPNAVPNSEAYKGNNVIDKDKPITVLVTSNPGLTFSRTLEPTDPLSLSKGSELKANARGEGGKLNLVPVYNTVGRVNGVELLTVARARYTMVEFDLVDKNYNEDIFINDDGNVYPALHFNNLNFSTREFVDELGNKTEKSVASSYLPVYKNVNHLRTFGRTKQEFFYNKRNLLMNITGNGFIGLNETTLYIDNFKMYEVDMVPFFQYFNNPRGSKGNINNAIQMPKTTDSLGTAPIIDASDESMVDDIRTENTVTSKYNGLIAKDIEVPENINWEQDYSIYRPQSGGTMP